jgi:hypothetical protein
MRRLLGATLLFVFTLTGARQEETCFASPCGDGVIDAGEECDPPGSTGCPPGSPAGAFLACNEDCTCPTLSTTTTTLPSCAPAPEAACQRPSFTRGALVILSRRLSPAPSRKRLVWKWRKGTITSTQADFGNPREETSYRLCLYDDVGGEPRLKMSARAAAAGLCGGVPCWKMTQTGFRYRDEELTPDGVSQIALTGADLGRGRIIVKGTGPDLALPDLPLSQDPTVRMQLVTSDGTCWEALYNSSARNREGEFKAPSD